MCLAYKIIYQVYNFRLKTQDTSDRDLSKENVDYIVNIEENNKILLDKFNKNKNLDKDFNIWFNKLFEEIKIDNELIGGYNQLVEHFEKQGKVNFKGEIISE